MEGPLHVPGYTVGRRLGSADSSMWLGTDDATGQPVTLRLVRGDPQVLRAGLGSATLVMRALEHPHVLPFHDMVETPKGPVLVLGGAEGGSLADVLRLRRGLTAGEMVTSCAPIAEAMAEMHHHGIVHGAVTPDEIVFARDGRPMLAGVGLASLGARVNLNAATIAPEVTSTATFAPAADVYSIAAVGLVAFTGQVSTEQLLVTGVAPAAQAVVVRAVGRNTRRRPDASALVNALYAIADPEPVELVAPEHGPSSPPPMSFTDPAVEQPSVPGPGHSGPGPGTGFDSGTSSDSDAGVGSDPEPGEMDDVTAYMRRAATSGRRARRAGASHDDEPASPLGGSGADPDAGAAASRESVRRGRERTAHEGKTRQTKVVDRAGRDRTGRGETARERGAASGKRASTKPNKTEVPAPSRNRSRGRRPSRGDLTRVASVLVVLLLVAGGVVIGQQLFGEDDDLPEASLRAPDTSQDGQADLCGGPRPAPEEEPPEVTDWTQEVERLYTLRARAFEEIDAELLCQVYAPTSEGLVRDVELLQEYVDNGVRTQNLSFEVIDTEVVEQNGGTVILEITDRLPAYQLVNDEGEVVEEKPGMEDEPWPAELVPIADEGSQTPTWRFG